MKIKTAKKGDLKAVLHNTLNYLVKHEIIFKDELEKFKARIDAKRT